MYQCFCPTEGSFKLINSSIENKSNEERRLHELDILAHKTLRDGLVAASLDCKEVIKSSEESLAFIEQMVINLEFTMITCTWVFVFFPLLSKGLVIIYNMWGLRVWGTTLEVSNLKLCGILKDIVPLGVSLNQ